MHGKEKAAFMRNKMVTTVLPVLVVCLGFTVGHLFFPFNKNTETTPSEQSTVSPVTKQPAVFEKEKRTVREDTYERLRDWMAQIPRPKRAQGSGVIFGRILTEAGKPLRGVVVTAVHNTAGGCSRESRLMEPRTLEERAREFVAEAFMDDLACAKTITRTNGFYRFSGLSQQTHWLDVTAPGYCVEARNRRWTFPTEDGYRVDFVAYKLKDVPFSILMPDGSEVDHARIEAYSKGFDSRSFLWSPQKNVMPLPPGVYRIQAFAGDNDCFESNNKIVPVFPDTQPDLVRIQLKEDLSICGKVIVPPGDDLDTVSLCYMRLSPGVTVDPNLLLSKGEREYDDAEKPDFTFEINDISLTPGRYVIGAGRTMDQIEAMAEVTMTDAPVHVELTLPPVDESRLLTVIPVSPTGAPVTNTDISAEWHTSDKRGGGIPYTKPGEGACRFIFEPCFREAVHDNSFECLITVESDPYGTKRRQWNPTEGNEITIALEEPAVLNLTLAGFIPEENGGPNVEIYVHDAGSFNSSDDTIGADGRMTVFPVQPGPCKISVYSSSRLFDEIRPTLLPGKNNVVLQTPVPLSLTITFSDEAPGTFVDLQKKDDRSIRFTTLGTPTRFSETCYDSAVITQDHIVRFTGLPTGCYTIIVWSERVPGEMTLNLDANMTVEYNPNPLNALKVVDVRENGPLGATGLMTGDVITGCENKRFQHYSDLSALIASAKENKRAHISVLRKGKRFELVIDSAMLVYAMSKVDPQLKPVHCKQ